MRTATEVMVVLLVSGVLLMGGCVTAAEPPFDTVTYAERASEADTAFGWYAYLPQAHDEVAIRRLTLPGEWERGHDRLPVDIYYPPGFRYRTAEPAIIVLAGAIKWSSNISLAAMLAAEGTTAVVIDTLAAGEALRNAMGQLRARADELFIDPERLAVWTEGHSSPEALEAVLDPGWRHHDCLQAAVFVSPVMFLGTGAGFSYEPSKMASDVPLFIARAEDDEFYEVRASISRFMEAAESQGIPVTYVESPLGGHNWMLEETAPEATEVIQEAVTFLNRRL